MHKRFASLTLFCFFAMLVAPTRAATVDLTDGEGTSGTINGALFNFNEVQPSGTGVFQPFVRMQSHGTQQGYNTSGRPLPFDEQSSPVFTHDLRLGDLASVNVGAGNYYQFALDINESQGGGNSYLSLDAVQIYTSLLGGQTTDNIASLGDLRYDLDANGDSFVLLDAANSHGSGSSDMTMLIPVDLFVGASADSYVYLYSSFGEQGVVGGGANRQVFGSSGGFEEWAALTGSGTNVIPEPASLGLLGAGALLIFGRRRRKAA